jgi:hypothetical protein
VLEIMIFRIAQTFRGSLHKPFQSKNRRSLKPPASYPAAFSLFPSKQMRKRYLAGPIFTKASQIPHHAPSDSAQNNNIMRAYLRKKQARLWVKLATLGLDQQRPPSRQLQPGDEERLLQTLIAMNSLLARAARI